jgi:hypothetical protein
MHGTFDPTGSSRSLRSIDSMRTTLLVVPQEVRHDRVQGRVVGLAHRAGSDSAPGP